MGAGAAIASGIAGIGGMFAGNKAASAQRAAAGSANRRLAAGKEEAIGFLDPYEQSGRAALSPLTALLTGQKYDDATGKMVDVSEQERMANFFQSPGYKFKFGQGMSAIEKSQAARGNLLSGGAPKELINYAQGMASDEYGTFINQLMQQAGMGQNAATSQGNYAMNAASNMANMDYNAGMANANKYSNLSNAAFGMAGLGMQGAMFGGGGVAPPSSAGGGGGGRYNSAYNLNPSFNTNLG